MLTAPLPLFVSGVVDKGFGRGSKELGIPTANYSSEVVKNLPHNLETGVYYGWSQIDNGAVHKMVMSVGWNPFYQNKVKTMEVHILHDFPEQFYGSLMKVCVLNYLRPEMNFPTLDDLISAIKSDVDAANKELDKPEFSKFREHEFFQQ
ncbi:hypothetical protein O3M35_008895 [Rhynocoris fuscipes]|uniref:Riboflavin kinase n=1 Tax=Rhynocoris fuscipes TaxID=488301 RepID=A0AAW1DDH9_9HEMI